MTETSPPKATTEQSVAFMLFFFQKVFRLSNAEIAEMLSHTTEEQDRQFAVAFQETIGRPLSIDPVVVRKELIRRLTQ